jgi:hypothetical protein
MIPFPSLVARDAASALEIAMTTKQIDPRLLQAAKYSPTLEYMIEHDIPLTREQFISMNYLGHPPEPWTAEHEGEVPAPWRDFGNVWNEI